MEIPNFLKRTQCFSLSDEEKILKEINSRSDSISDIKIRNQEGKKKNEKSKTKSKKKKRKISRKSTNKSKNHPKIMTNPSNECCLFTNTNDKVTD